MSERYDYNVPVVTHEAPPELDHLRSAATALEAARREHGPNAPAEYAERVTAAAHALVAALAPPNPASR